MSPDEEPTEDQADIDELPSDPTPLGTDYGLGMGTGMWRGGRGTVFRPSTSTPFEEDEDGNIPAPVLWVMKYRRRGHLPFSRHDGEPIRLQLGTGDDAVFAMDDGAKRAMVARLVGVDPEGLQYVLVGRITVQELSRYLDDGATTRDIFDTAKDLCLCSVYEATDAVSNIVPVETYQSANDIPEEFLPSEPYLHFEDSDSDSDSV